MLQSFGLISFLILATLISWGLKLIIEKELKNIIYKLFFLTLYLIFGCTFLHITFNNSFWLLDNGNSGFIGELIYKFMGEQQMYKQIEKLMKSKKYNNQVGKLRAHRATGQDLTNDRIELATKDLPVIAEINAITSSIINFFWPGPLTLILPRKKNNK